MTVLNSLFPVFVIIVLGASLRRWRFFSDEILSGLNRLTYWVGLPCLLFNKIAAAQHTGQNAANLFLVMFLSMLGGIVAAYVVARLLQLPATSTGTFVQSSFRGNLAFIGLPVIIYSAMAQNAPGLAAHETLAVLVLAPMAITYNAFSVLVLVLGRKKIDGESLKTIALQLLSNPLLIASTLGFVLSIANTPLPVWLARTTAAVGQTSLPLALIGIGGSLVSVQIRGSLLAASSAALLKVGVTPVIGYLLATALGLSPAESKITLIYLSCPTAAASFILVDQLGGDKHLAASAIVISTILAVISLGFAVSLT